MRGSEWSVWLFIYQGAFVIIRKSFDCYRCITDVFDLLAQPQSMMPYVHMGFSTVLYISSVFSNEKGEFFPISQFISFRYENRFAKLRLQKIRPYLGYKIGCCLRQVS